MDILKLITCCLSNGDHIVKTARLLQCGGNACEQCIIALEKEGYEDHIKCNYCSQMHDLNEIKGLGYNPVTKLIINSSLPQLKQHLKAQIETELSKINDLDIKNRINAKFDCMENDIDIKIETLKTQLDNLSAKFRKDLKNVKQNVENWTLTPEVFKMKEKLETMLVRNEAKDSEEYFKLESDLKDIKSWLDKYIDQIPKFSFHFNEEVVLNENIIGELEHSFPYICNEIKTLESTPLTVFRMAHLKNQNKLILSGVQDNVLKHINLDDNNLKFVDYYSDTAMKRPFAITISDTDEIFVNCFESDIILIFDSNMKKKREFKLKRDEQTKVAIYADLAIDNDTRLLFVADNNNHLVLIVNSENGEQVKLISTDSPFWTRLSEEKIFVVNSNILECLRNHETPISNEYKSFISIFDKSSLTIIQKIPFENNLHPRGMCLNEDENIIITLLETNVDEDSYCHYLLVMDQNWRFIQKLNLNGFSKIKNIFDMIVVDNKFVFSGEAIGLVCIE